MASTVEPRLPSREQCNALTDDQCRMIQYHLDPHEVRLNKDWEKPHQPKLIRLYMQLLSYKSIEIAMRSRITASYRTYNNRFREWFFPGERDGRAQAVRMLYAIVTSGNSTSQSTPSNSLSILAMRPTPTQRLLLPAHSRQSTPHTMPPYFVNALEVGPNPRDRTSTTTASTSASSGVQSNYTFLEEDDEVFSNPRFSTATGLTTATNSTSLSSMSGDSQYQPSPLKPPTHDAAHGIWNDVLRVIPCGIDHTCLRWQFHFRKCSICGFSRWHALMLHARSMDISEYVRGMSSLAHVERVDFAGNYPIHYLMSVGVGMIYFTLLAQHGDTDYQNAFGQNPLHVLNPQDLGDQLISFLEWFKAREQPPGLLLTQRDIFCRTPLQMLLQHPLERHMYRKIFDVFPFPTHHLQSFNNKGHSVMAMMMKAAVKLMSESPSGFAKIQAGIAEVKTYLYDAQTDFAQSGQEYGFHDIARGDRNGVYYGVNPTCRICHTNNHSNSYLDQLKCACAYGRDRNGPDGTGLTPAHAFVLFSRCNNDPAHTPENASQIAELFKTLVPTDDQNWREILHVLDPGGYSLVFNVAVRGYDEILEHILRLEDPVRRRAMVNSCGKTRRGEERSVLAAVQKECGKVMRDINEERDEMKRGVLVELAERLTRVKYLLIDTGAEWKPSVTTRWQVSFI